MSYLTFQEKDKEVSIINTKDEHLGYIRKVRVGSWVSWCLFLNEDCYMSASCLDEVRDKIRFLNSVRFID